MAFQMDVRGLQISQGSHSHKQHSLPGTTAVHCCARTHVRSPNWQSLADHLGMSQTHQTKSASTLWAEMEEKVAMEMAKEASQFRSNLRPNSNHHILWHGNWHSLML
jgi:hypothetical protein